MPDYTHLFRIAPSPNPSGWVAEAGGVIELRVDILRGPCTNLNLTISPASLRFLDSGSATTNRVISPPVASGGVILKQIQVPAVFSGVVTMGGVVTTNGGGWAVGGGSIPRDANAGPWTLTLTTLPPGPNDPGAVGLTWFQARFLALSGVKIRRAGWQDRYLMYFDSLWWLHRYDAVTKAETSSAPVLASEWAAVDFRAADWTPHGIVAADLLTAARAVKVLFP